LESSTTGVWWKFYSDCGGNTGETRGDSEPSSTVNSSKTRDDYTEKRQPRSGSPENATSAKDWRGWSFWARDRSGSQILAKGKWFNSGWYSRASNTSKVVRLTRLGVPGMGLKGMLMMGAVMATMAAGFMWYFNHSQAKIATLIENNAQLEVAVQTNEEAIRSISILNEAANREIRRVNDELAASRQQNRELLGRLAANDLGAFGQTNPEGLERVINRASNNVLRCFELMSGAELNERELAATDGRSFNRECPWMWPGNQ
jgi:hypothetical protein